MRPDMFYKSYVLRVWQVERNQQLVMVASLDDCQTNQHRAFARLADLLAFLESQAQQQAEESNAEQCIGE